MSTPLDDIPEEQQELSSFTVNANGRGGFRGNIKVEHPYRPGEFVTRPYNSSPIYVSESGNEFGLFTVRSENPIAESRERRLDPADAPNAHPGLSFRSLNQGVYFPASEEALEAAKAAGKPIPAIRGYVVMPFADDEGEKIPHVVELAAWEQKPKGAAPDDGRVTWYAGTAEIFDRVAYLANSKKAGAEAAIDPELTDDDWRQPDTELEPELPAEPAPNLHEARKGADKRARKRGEPKDPELSEN
jgi:hypothetical protein